MPADETLPQVSSKHHGDGVSPYPCYAWPKAPSAPWSLKYGFCRHSLDSLNGSTDPRCPASCPHKAPKGTDEVFDDAFARLGASGAAEMMRERREELAAIKLGFLLRE